MRRYFNRLWVRLSLFSTLMVLVGVLLVGLGSLVLSRNEFLESFIENRIRADGGLVDQLAIYYKEHNNWQGVSTLIDQFDPPPIRGPNGAWAVTFADQSGVVLYDPHGDTTGQTLTADQIADAITITVDSQIRGYIRLERINVPPPPNVPESLQPFIFRELSTLLLILAVLVGTVGIIAGIILSRSLSAPLNELVKTVRQFGNQNFSIRAKVWGSEEVVAAATAFNNMADAMEQAESVRRNLVADVAHELRTPLAVLQANLQAILDGVYPNNEEELKKLMEQTELLGHLVTDLHDLAQLEAKQRPVNLDTIDLTKVVNSTTRQFEAVAANHQLDLCIAVPPQPLTIQGDPSRIQQIVNNLVQNAMVNTPPGGKVEVSLSQEDHHAVLKVADNGTGIRPEHLPHVFERFYRIDRSRSRATGGAGLGLAIVKAIADLHGGDVAVASSGVPGQGATFSVSLPLAPDEQTSAS